MENGTGIENNHQGQAHPAGNTGVQSPASQVEGAGSSPEASNGSYGSGYNAEQARRRVEAKLNERMANMESAILQISQAVTQPRQNHVPSASGNEPNLWEQPETYLAQREERLLNKLEERFKNVTQESVVTMETRMARELIKSEAGNDPDAEYEINRIAQANGYDVIAERKPVLAAENAIRDWKAYKAGSASQNRVPTANQPSRAQVPAINGGASGATPKEWGAQEIKQARENGTYDTNRDAIRASLKRQGLIK